MKMMQVFGLKDPQFNFTKSDVRRNDSNTVVVVFGWLGARQKNVDKFTALYRNMGFDTLDFIPPMSSIFFPQRAYRISKQLHDEIKQNHGQKTLVFHVLSSNGYYNYLLLRKEMQNSSIPHNIFGTVFDSCPSELTTNVVSSALVTIFLSESRLFKKLPEIIQNPFQNLIHFNFNFLLNAHLKRPAVQAQVDHVSKLSKTIHGNSKQLYFYSRRDPLTSLEYLHEHINLQKESGVDVFHYNFVDSEHVAHFKIYPETYSKHLSEFLKPLLKNE